MASFRTSEETNHPPKRFLMQLYLRLLHWVRPYSTRVALALAAMLLFGFSSALPFPLIKPMLDRIFVENDPESLVQIPLILVGIFLLKGVANFGATYLMRQVGQNVIADLRRELFGRMLGLPLSFFQQASTGDLLSRVLHDTTQVETALSRQVAEIIKEALSLLFLAAALIWLSWRYALISIVGLPLLLAPLLRLSEGIRKASGHGQIRMGELSSVLQEALAGILIVKSFRMEPSQRRVFDEANDGYRDHSLNAARLEAMTAPLIELFAALLIATTIYLGGLEVLQGETTTGTFFAFMAALFAMYKPVKSLSRAGTQLQMALAAATRIFEILDTRTEEDTGEQELPGGRFRVRFRKVSFKYTEQPVLDGVDLELEPGKMIALVGTSGAGKTTIGHLLLRLYEPTAGQIEIGDVPLKEIKLKSLRNNIGLVSQETVLFRATVRENLCYGQKDVPDSVLVRALRAAAAREFVEALPNGLDTHLGDRGANLSGGQRQRLALARALVKDPPILILDEATSALDSESEQKIQEALSRIVHGRTLLVIAHRLSTIKNADQIVVLEQGRVVEQGTHGQLLDLGGVYARLYHQGDDSAQPTPMET